MPNRTALNGLSSIESAIEAIQDIGRLEALFDRVFDPTITDWDNLLAS